MRKNQKFKTLSANINKKRKLFEDTCEAWYMYKMDVYMYNFNEKFISFIKYFKH